MIDTREVAAQLQIIESVIVIPLAASTNTLARRILEDCIENDVPLPSAVIVAREQSAGRGRGERSWHSPADAGIYATILHTREVDALPLLPLQVAVTLAKFLREKYSIDAVIKWPNDILVGPKKIAGILIEARTKDDSAFAAIGVGVNVRAVDQALSAQATSIAEASGRAQSTDEAIASFIRAIDKGLQEKTNGVVEQWSSLAMHRAGDQVSFHLPNGEITGTWQKIDRFGRAVVSTPRGVEQISAADLILTTPPA